MRHSSRRAFTLVEILIVIAIIGILSAILFPVFARVRENGRATVCSSNMKQLGMAYQQYLQDSGQRYPGPGCYYDGFAGLRSWKYGGNWVNGFDDQPLASITDFSPTGKKADVQGGALYPYVREASVYRCPSLPEGEIKGITYSMNCALTGLHTVRVKTPTEIVLLVDEDKANDGYFFAVNDSAAGSSTNSTDALTQVHNGGGNLLFADGHVKFFPFNAFVLTNNNDAKYGAVSKDNKWRDTGVPRFHDRAFGPYGSAIRYGASATDPDYCNAKQR